MLGFLKFFKVVEPTSLNMFVGCGAGKAIRLFRMTDVESMMLKSIDQSNLYVEFGINPCNEEIALRGLSRISIGS